jgi:hypothetical protein
MCAGAPRYLFLIEDSHFRQELSRMHSLLAVRQVQLLRI